MSIAPLTPTELDAIVQRDYEGEIERLQIDHALLTEKVASLEMRLALARQLLKQRAPYGEMCMHPEKCVATGRCPCDPVCGN